MPAAGSAQAMSEELEREVVGVLETYTDKGGMAADNVLDKARWLAQRLTL